MDPARVADDWWHSLPPERRVQIHHWVDRPAAHAEVEGQYEIPLPRQRTRR